MIPVEVIKIFFYAPSKGYAVILQEIGGEKRKLPVIVGSYEAQAIALALEGVEPPRPLTHDLTSAMVKSLNINFQKVVISNLEEGTFYADIYVRPDENGELKIDSRPSDAVALALRLSSPIFVEEKVMDEAGVLEDSESDFVFEDSQDNAYDVKKGLENQLQKAIEEEEYEMAATLRDKIIKLKDKESSN